MGTFWCWHYPTINNICSYIQEIFKVICEDLIEAVLQKSFSKLKTQRQ